MLSDPQSDGLLFEMDPVTIYNITSIVGLYTHSHVVLDKHYLIPPHPTLSG